MGHKKTVWIASALGVVLLAGVVLAFAFVGREETYRSVRVLDTQGEAYVERNDDRFPVYGDLVIQGGDAMETGEDGRVDLRLDEDKYLIVEESSRVAFELEGDEKKGAIRLTLTEGAIYNQIENPLSENDSYEIVTPDGTMAVRGTRFRVAIGRSSDGTLRETTVSVLEGEVHVQLSSDSGEETILEAGEEAIIERDMDADTDTELNLPSRFRKTKEAIDLEALPAYILEMMDEDMLSGLRGEETAAAVSASAQEEAQSENEQEENPEEENGQEAAAQENAPGQLGAGGVAAQAAANQLAEAAPEVSPAALPEIPALTALLPEEAAVAAAAAQTSAAAAEDSSDDSGGDSSGSADAGASGSSGSGSSGSSGGSSSGSSSATETSGEEEEENPEETEGEEEYPEESEEESGEEEPGEEEPGTEETSEEEPGTEETSEEEPGTEETGEEEPGTEETSEEESYPEETGTEESYSEETSEEESSTEELSEEEPYPEETGTEESSAEEPGTEESNTEESTEASAAAETNSNSEAMKMAGLALFPTVILELAVLVGKRKKYFEKTKS